MHVSAQNKCCMDTGHNQSSSFNLNSADDTDYKLIRSRKRESGESFLFPLLIGPDAHTPGIIL